MRKLLTAIFSITVSLFAGTVFAGQATGSFDVTASVTASCTVSAPTLAFGAYNDSNTDGSNTMTINCTLGAGYTILLGNGSNYNAGSRRMNNSTYYLNYGLYTDSGRTTAWPALGVSGTGTGANQNPVIYGRIPSGQLSIAGAGGYTDTIQITVNY